MSRSTVIEGSLNKQPRLNLPAVKDPAVAENEDLNGFLERIAESLREQQALAAWHITLFAKSGGKIELPYRHTDSYLYATKYDTAYYVKGTDILCENQEYPWRGSDSTSSPDWSYEYRSTPDMEKTLEYLALVTQTAKKAYPGVFVEKKYTDDTFQLVFTIPINVPNGETEKVTVTYNSKRDAVCKKKVVGTEEVPEKVTPAYTKEIVEWECEPVSLLGLKVDAIEA